MTSSNLSVLPKFRADTAPDEIRRITLESPDLIVITRHCRQRMSERDVSIKQLKAAIIHGDQIGTATYCTDTERGFRVKFQLTRSGCPVTVIAKLVERNESMVIAITTWI